MRKLILIFLITIIFSHTAFADKTTSILQLTTTQQIEDFTRGCTFFATGGGGDPKFGQQMLNQALAAGRSIQIIDIRQLKDDDKTICPFLMGSAGPETTELKQNKKTFGLTKETVVNMPAAAAKLLAQQQSAEIAAVMPLELGGASTASSVATAAWLNIPVIDGDYTGRAMPEITSSIPAIKKMTLYPLASADAYGNQVLIMHTTNDQITERIGKQIAIASFGLVGQANLLLPVNQVKNLMLPNTLSRAYHLGVAIRQARENKTDPIATIIKFTHAKIVFTGKVIENNAQEKEGYYVGDIVIQGTDSFQGQQFKIWFKNENLMSWLNAKPYISSPDLITLVEQSSGEPLINSQVKMNMSVVVFGLPAPAIFRSNEGLEKVGPNHFGFNIPYQPF